MPDLRRLGRSDLAIAPLVLGGNVFGVNGMDRTTSFAVLDAFVDAGGTMIDTADMYANYLPDGKGGDSEEMIGAWLRNRGRRDDVQIATKVGGPMGPGTGGLGSDWIARAIDASLARLGTDHVDLYFAHFDDPSVPQAEVAHAFDALVRAGKVRSIGASNFALDRLASALAIAEGAGLHGYGVIQPQYNLLERAIEDTDLPLAERYDLGVVTFFSLAQGYLSGKYRVAADLGRSRRGKSVAGYLDGRGPAVLDVLDEIAADRAVPVAAVALAWILARPGVTAPIASATSVAQLADILPAMNIVLTADEVARLDAASAGPPPPLR